MIKIEVKNPGTEHVTGTSKQGRPYSFYRQSAYAHLPGKAYPVEFEMTHDQASDAYQPGFYSIDPSSIYVDRFGGLALGRLKLVPVQAAARSAA